MKNFKGEFYTDYLHCKKRDDYGKELYAQNAKLKPEQIAEVNIIKAVLSSNIEASLKAKTPEEVAKIDEHKEDFLSYLANSLQGRAEADTILSEVVNSSNEDVKYLLQEANKMDNLFPEISSLFRESASSSEGVVNIVTSFANENGFTLSIKNEFASEALKEQEQNL